MATPDELFEQYKTDPELKKEVKEILEDEKITPNEFFGFIKKHNVQANIKDFHVLIKKAKNLGLIK